MKKLNANDFDNAINGSALAIVDFFATWCGPCKAMEPSLDTIDGNGVDVFKVDIDENPEIAVRYGVRSVPTLLLTKGGELADIKVGAQSLSQLQSWVRQNS